MPQNSLSSRRMAAMFQVALLAILAACPMLGAQEAQQGVPSFEVSSVKPDPLVPGPGHWRTINMTCANGRFVSNGSIRNVITWAWDISPADHGRLDGYHNWGKVADDYYLVEAKAAAPVTLEQCRLMVRKLLQDRFQRRTHKETRLIDAFDLITSKDGPKIKRVTDPDAPPNGPGFTIDGSAMQMHLPSLKGWTMDQLAEALGVARLGRRVFDRTGLEGIYRISMSFRSANGSGDYPDVTTALREQLGLELRAAKEHLDVLVVDRLERPSAN